MNEAQALTDDLGKELRDLSESMKHSAGAWMVPGWDGWKVAHLLDRARAVLAAEPAAPCKDCPGRQSLMCCKQPREPAAPTLCPITYCHRSVQERDTNGCKHCRPSCMPAPTVPRAVLEAAVVALDEQAWHDGLCVNPDAEEAAQTIREALGIARVEGFDMKRLICWLRGHRWGSWRNPKTHQYHSVCCERCGLWYGDTRGVEGDKNG